MRFGSHKNDQITSSTGFIKMHFTLLKMVDILIVLTKDTEEYKDNYFEY